MKNLNTVIAISGVLLVPTMSAHAQDEVHKYHVQLGANVLVDKGPRVTTKSPGFSLGLGYRLPTSPVQGYRGSVDFLFNKSNRNRSETMGLFYSLRKVSEGESASQFYYGASLGVAQSKYKTSGMLESGQVASISGDDTGIAGRLLLGVMFRGGLMIEGAFNLTPQVKVVTSKVKTTSFSLSVGKAF